MLRNYFITKSEKRNKLKKKHEGRIGGKCFYTFVYVGNIKIYTFKITFETNKTFYDFLMDIFADKDRTEIGRKE